MLACTGAGTGTGTGTAADNAWGAHSLTEEPYLRCLACLASRLISLGTLLLPLRALPWFSAWLVFFSWYLCCTALHCLSALLCFIKARLGPLRAVQFYQYQRLCLFSLSPRLSCTYTSINCASHFHSRSPFVAGLKLPSTTASSYSFSASPHSLHQRQNQTQAQRQAKGKAKAAQPGTPYLRYLPTTSRTHCNLEFDHLRLSSNNTTPTLPSCVDLPFAFRLSPFASQLILSITIPIPIPTLT